VNGVFFDKPSSYYNCFSSKVTITHETERVALSIGSKGLRGFYLLFLLSSSVSTQPAAVLPAVCLLEACCFFLILLSSHLISGQGEDFHKIRRAKSVSAVLRWDGIMSLLSSFFFCSPIFSLNSSLSDIDYVNEL
jgi:hypothetical protein